MDDWTLALFLGICFLILFTSIYHFKPITNTIAENFADSFGFSSGAR